MIQRLFKNRQFMAGSCFAAAGACICQFVILCTAVLGTGPAALATVLFSVAVGVVVSSHAIRRIRNAGTGQTDLATYMSMTAVTAFLSWIAPQLFATAAEMGAAIVEPMNSMTWMTLLPSAVMMIIATATVLIWCQLNVDGRDTDRNGSFLWVSAGLAVLLTHSQFAFPMAATCTALLVIVASHWLAVYFTGQTQTDSRVATNGAGTNSEIDGAVTKWPRLVIAAAAGIVLVAVSEFAVRLFAGTVPVFLIAASLTATGCWLVQRTLGRRVLRGSVWPLAFCMLAATFPLLFSSLVELNLSWNSHFTSPWLLLAARGTQIAVFATLALAPVMLEYGKLDGSRWFTLSAITCASAGCGCMAIGMSVLPLTLFILGTGVAAFATAIVSIQRSTKTLRQRSTRRRVLGSFAAAGVAVVISLSGTLDFSRSAQLLFSDRSVAAVRLGLDRELIRQSDSTRLVASATTPSGDVTVWRRSGYLFEFRRNGELLGRVSSDTRLCPQPPADMLLSVLPLVLHADPRQVLLLGDDTGACLRSCASFPIQHITAVRNDEYLTELARQFTWSRLQVPPDRDDRVTLAIGTPALAVRRDWRQRFDVVIADSGNAATAAASSEFTSEFYDSARRQLHPGGIFCQRFRQQNYGPNPLRRVLGTLAKSFQHAAAIQSVPGEVLLVATDATDGLLDDQVLSRLQRSHVRREIAAAGWDWCQVAALHMLDVSDPMGIFAEQRAPKGISVSNNWFAMSLPLESARWGNKAAEQLVALAPYQTVLAENIAGSEDHNEANRRISALAQETEILCGIPDQPFFYRKSLRMELQRNPRPPVETVRNGNVTRKTHPLDKLRQDYFVALGNAIRVTYAGERSDEVLTELSKFTSACEPLLSRFAHHELIRLYELAGHPDGETEFQHRMHVVYFAQQADASVRPVIAALQQLANDPSLVQGDAERFDQLNSMLQKLIERWESRTAWEPKSALRVQNDVDQSIHVANRAMERMESLTDAAGLTHQDFVRRRRFINAALIKPLREYREQVLAHRAKHEDPGSSTADDGSDLPLLLPQNALNTN
jgi:spermidine synthase